MNKKKSLPFLCLLLAAVLCGMLSSCAGLSEKTPMPVQETTVGEGDYRIYTMSQTMTKLAWRTYHTETKEAEVLVNELIREMKSVPSSPDQKCAIPDPVSVFQTEVDPPVLSLYLNDEYWSMSPAEEILCRAAIVRTLTQIAGIDALRFYIGMENPAELMDGNGEPVGLLKASDFIEHMTDNEKAEQVEVTLYFVNEEGDLLVPEQRTISVSSAKSLERAVVDQLISGPTEQGHFATLAPATEILSLTTRNGVCYVSFDRAFQQESLDLKPAIIIYSLVNTLTRLQSVEQVQIALEGNSSLSFLEVIPLENPLSAKPELVAAAP